MATGETKTKWNGDNGNHLPETNKGDLFEISLSYTGKLPESEVLTTSPAQLHLLWGNQNNTTQPNQLCYGDNLSILANLINNPEIRGKVQLVYIDPPFSTNSVFKSRNQKDAYHDLLTGSAFIEFIRQRLILLRELLADDGSIYVHLDENMAFHIKVIMDEIFGRQNFRNFITRRKCNPKNYTRNSYGDISDYILFYSKTDGYIWNRPYETWTIERAQKEYQYIEPNTGRRYKKVPGDQTLGTGQAIGYPF